MPKWYNPPNLFILTALIITINVLGHTYHVDACGKPMEKFNCPTCGASIGGLDHELVCYYVIDNRSLLFTLVFLGSY